MLSMGRSGKFFLVLSIVALIWLYFDTPSAPSYSDLKDEGFEDLSQDDVVLIMKSGYSVLRERLEPQLATFAHPRYGRTEKNTIILADYNTTAGEQAWQVHDVVASHYSNPGVAQSEKFQRYIEQARAIDDTKINAIPPGTNNGGWEIDAYKFLPGWQLAARTFPKAKWFVGIDDDTFVIWQNIFAFLRLLDPTEKRFLGTAAYMLANMAKFIHGGSIIIASQAAVQYRFIENTTSLASLNAEANTLCCGDGVLGMAFRDVGIEVDDSFRLFFNGDDMKNLKVSRENACLPIMGIHHVEGYLMKVLDSLLSNHRGFLSWSEVFKVIFLHSHLPHLADQGIPGWLFIDNGVVVERARDEGECREVCRNTESCLGWSYNLGESTCRGSSIISPGHSEHGVISGLDWDKVKAMQAVCEKELKEGTGWTMKVAVNKAKRKGAKIPDMV